MRVSFRSRGHKDYWSDRWRRISVDEPPSNTSSYPLKHALLALGSDQGPILEAGCGAGRILRLLQSQGREVVAFDYIHPVLAKLKRADQQLQITTADVTSLPYKDNAFSSVLAFGLLHNLPLDMALIGLAEMSRVLKPGGGLCLSYRADNLQNWINDFVLRHLASKQDRYNRGLKIRSHSGDKFHKMNLSRRELTKLVVDAKLKVEGIEPVSNMPLLYKFRLFRFKTHRQFDENLARAEGYRLSAAGQFFHRVLMCFPNTFCNVYVVYARKI